MPARTFRSVWGWTLVILAAAGIMTAFWLRDLRQERARVAAATAARLEAERLDRLRRENASLREQLAAWQPISDAALLRAKQELGELEHRLQVEKQLRPLPLPTEPERLVRGSVWKTAELTNRGRATPEATFETALWAATGGDVDALAGLLRFADPNIAATAQQGFWQLSPATRQRYGTPERLIAALLLTQLPTGAVKIVHWGGTVQPSASVTAEFIATDGTVSSYSMGFLPDPDGWNVAVTRGMLARCAAQLAPSKPATN